MRRGELAGIVHVVGKPNELFAKFKPEPGFHFLPVEFGPKFEDYYIPSELTSKDYPNLIPEGQSVPTISVAALLAVYNWRPDTDRYRRCVRFVEYLFDRFEKLKGPTYPARLEGNELGRHHPRLDALSARTRDGQPGHSESNRRPEPCAPASGTRRARQSCRAGTVVQSVPGMEQATEAAVNGSNIVPVAHEGGRRGSAKEAE